MKKVYYAIWWVAMTVQSWAHRKIMKGAFEQLMRVLDETRLDSNRK